MCAVRTKRNDLSPTGRLPPEILSRIFSFHAINQPISRHRRCGAPPSSSSPIRLGKTWIIVTYVCHRWRQVALADPNLWRTINFDLGAEWTQEMLARSKAAPISYSRKLSLPTRVSKRMLRMHLDDESHLRKHLSHVQRLALSGDVESLAPAVRALTTPAPQLESLELLPTAFRSRQGCIILPSDLLAHNAPKLREINLSGCAVPWDSPLFRDLTHLNIHIPSFVPFPLTAQYDLLSIPTFERLLSILEAMPSLQVLTLRGCLPPPKKSTGYVVPLRHMSKLSLDGSVSEVVAILERVSLPGSASLSLRCADHNDGLLDTLVSLLASHFRAPDASISPLSRMFIGQADLAHPTMKVWDASPQSTGPLLHLTLRSSPMAVAESFPRQVCKALPLQDLHTLSITYPNSLWSTADWVDVCAHCPKITDLDIHTSWAFNLSLMLKNRKAFPSLDKLALSDADFLASLSSGHTERFSEVFLESLRKRKNAGIPVRRVNLASCMVTRSWVVSLREVVNDVKWDFSEDDFDSQQDDSGSYDSDE